MYIFPVFHENPPRTLSYPANKKTNGCENSIAGKSGGGNKSLERETEKLFHISVKYDTLAKQDFWAQASVPGCAIDEGGVVF